MMDEKELRQMMFTYKELAYTRKAALSAIQEIVYVKADPPEEQVEKVKRVLIASGFTYRED